VVLHVDGGRIGLGEVDVDVYLDVVGSGRRGRDFYN
jgi:hypothetical protein